MRKSSKAKIRRRRRGSKRKKRRTPQAFMKDFMEQLNLTPLEVAQRTDLEEEQVLSAIEGDCSYEVQCRICGFLRKSYESQIKKKVKE